MKTTRFFILVALVTSLFVSSCSKDVVSLPVPIPDFAINFSVNVEEPQASVLRSDNVFKTFSGSGTINMNDDGFKTLKYNLDNIIISSLSIGTVEIRASSSSGTLAKDIVLSSPVGEFKVAQYAFGSTYYSDPTLISYAKKLFEKFIKDKEITVNVSGLTDADAGGDFTISLFFGGVEIKAKVL